MAPCQGYQLKERKTVKADENSITVFYEMENRGKKELSLREYCHNFISIDYYPLGPEYTLKMPVVPQNEKKPERGTGTIQGTDCGFSFTGYADTACAVRINSDEILPGEFYWKLSHSGGMAAVEERVSFKPSWILVWSVDNNISPEVSYCFTLPPGKAISYWRRWTFTDSLFQP